MRTSENVLEGAAVWVCSMGVGAFGGDVFGESGCAKRDGDLPRFLDLNGLCLRFGSLRFRGMVSEEC